MRTSIWTSRFTVPVILVLLATAVVWAGGVSALPNQSELSATGPRVYFQPIPVQVGLGLARNVDVVVEDIQGLYAVEMRISFPSNLVAVQDADPAVPGIQIARGNIFDGFDTYPIQNSADNSTGRIEYILSITGSRTGKSGSGIIATIPLQGLLAGDAVMAFVEIVLCERDGTSIQVDLGTGQVDVGVVGATATTAATATVTRTPNPAMTATHTVAATAGPTRTPAPRAAVRVVPQFSQVAAGDTDEVQVVVQGVSDLYGFEGRIDYNGALLDVEDADPGAVGIQVWTGDVFDSFSYQVLQNEVSDNGVFGQVHFTAFINAGLSHGFDGDSVLFWIVFRGVSPGLTNVTISQMDLIDHSGTTIPRDLYNGQIEVLPAGPTATQTRTATATTTASLTLTPTITLTPSNTATTDPSVTASPTATQTSVLPTPTPLCLNRILNGGFETLSGAEAPPWQRQGSVTYTSVEKYAGLRSAWLGGFNSADNGIYQQVTIPTHATPGEETTEATLSYWWGIVTQETDADRDHLRVRVRDSSGVLLRELESLGNDDASPTWEQSSWDLSDYEGQTIRICFEAVNDATFSTSFYVDEVQLIVCEILLPTATPTATASPTISLTPSATGLPTGTPTVTPTPVVDVFQYTAGQYENCWDAYLSSWEPTVNYGHTGALSIRTAGVKRPLLYFDVSRVPAGVTVINASLQLRATYYQSHSQLMTASVYGLKREWVEMQTTWQRAREQVLWTQGGANDTLEDRDTNPVSALPMPDTNTWYSFDITSLVQGWVNGARPNYGLMLIGSGNTVEMSFYSSEYSIPADRPRLVVKYIYGAVPTPTVTPNVSVTANATVSPTPTATPTTSGDVVVVQQGYLGYSGVVDTYLNQWDRNVNYGRNVTTAIRQGDVKSTLVRFDLTGVPHGTIQSAKLSLYALSRTNVGNLTIDAYPVLRAWAEEQATYNLATAAVSWGLPGCASAGVDLGAVVATKEVGALNAWHDFDITTLVRGWLNGTIANNGVILKGRGPTSVEYTYAASEYWWALAQTPKLTIQYALP
jgi:hypothetical protein